MLARPFSAMTTFFWLFVGLLGAAPASELRARTVPSGTRVASNLIVGRAVCRDTTWLLTDLPELISVSHTAPRVVVRTVKGFRSDERPWGLACLGDGSLWTHTTSTTLTRVADDGGVRQRVSVQRPRLLLFGWLNRVLVIELPISPGTPAFATVSADGKDSRPWPGLLARSADSRASLLARNLANCGFAKGSSLPCWFVDERRATMSDGMNAYTVTFPALSAPDVDPEAPIWDLAFQGTEKFWLLVGTKNAARSHKAGGRLVSADKKGVQIAALPLAVPARTIVSASDTRCVLLTVDGALLEVVAQ